MNIDELNKAIINIAEKASLGGTISMITDSNKLSELFLKVYSPNVLFCNSIDLESNYSLVINKILPSSKLKKINYIETINNIYKNINIVKTIRIYNINVYFCDNCIISIRDSDNTKDGIIENSFYSDIIIICDLSDLKNIIKEEYIVYKDDDIRSMEYVIYDNRGFFTKSLNVIKPDINVSLNYNDDFPYEKCKNILSSKDSGIIIFHGIPGTGKSFIIRDLIYNVDKKFIFLDNSCFNYINDSSFIELLIHNKDAIFVLEDCETLLQDRSVGNERLSTLLNLSDGILGDSLNLKFICTFNSNLTSIDKGILRKGRLKLKYEFKELTEDKVKALYDKFKIVDRNIKSTTLCDIYNYYEENGNKKSNKIGFNI